MHVVKCKSTEIFHPLYQKCVKLSKDGSLELAVQVKTRQIALSFEDNIKLQTYLGLKFLDKPRKDVDQKSLVLVTGFANKKDVAKIKEFVKEKDFGILVSKLPKYDANVINTYVIYEEAKLLLQQQDKRVLMGMLLPVDQFYDNIGYKIQTVAETFADKEVVFMGFTAGTDAGKSIASWVSSQGAKIVKKVNIKNAKNTVVIHKPHKSVIDKIEEAENLKIPIIEYSILLKKVEDVAKQPTVVKSDELTKAPSAKPSEVFNPPSVKHPSKKTEDVVKQKVHKFVEQWKQQQAEKYVDESHKKFCETGETNKSLLKKAIVNFNGTVQIPLWKLKNKPFRPAVLDQAKLWHNFEYIQFVMPRFDFNNYSIRHIFYKNLRQSSALSYLEDIIDFDWVDQSNRYIYNMKKEDLFTLIGYHKLQQMSISRVYLYTELNALAQESLQVYFPFFFQALEAIKSTKDLKTIISQKGEMCKIEAMHKIVSSNISQSKMYKAICGIIEHLDFINFWKPVIDKFHKDLDNIIRNAPAVNKKMVVFEIVKDKQTDIKVSNNIYKSDNVISPTFTIAPNDIDPNARLRRITIFPKSRVLLFSNFTQSNNIEVLLSSDSQYYITKHKQYLPLNTNSLCPDKNKKWVVSDVVLVK